MTDPVDRNAPALDSDEQDAVAGAAATHSVSERAIKDTIKQYGSQLLVGLSAVAFAAWFNRLLPARELALWPVCVTLGSVVAALASFGLGDTFVRVVPAQLARGEREEAARLLRSGLLLNLAGCVLLSITIYLLHGTVARYLLHDEAGGALVRTMALAAFFTAYSERLSWALQAVQEFGKRALINAITGILRTPLALALYLLMDGPQGVILALTITPMIATVLSAIWLWRHLSPARGFCPVRETLGQSMHFYGVSLVSILSIRMNPLVIALFVPGEVLATYFVASSISGYLAALDHFAIDSVLPKLSEKGASARSVTETESVFSKCTRYLFLALIPMHLLVAAAATPLMMLYGGPQYAGGGLVLSLLCVGMLISTVVELQRAHMVVFARPAHVLNYQIMQSITNIVGLVAFVPFLGALGAALNDLVRTISGFAVSFHMLRQTMRVKFDTRALIVALAASGAALGVMYLLHPGWHGRAVEALPILALCGLVYLLALARRLSASDVDLMVRCVPAGWRRARGGGRVGRAIQWLWAEPRGGMKPITPADGVEGP